MPDGADATTELGAEHAELEKLVQRIAMLEPGPQRTALVREGTARYLAHTRAEERYLLPAFRQYLAGGDTVAVEQERHAEAMRTAVERIERAGQGDEYEALVGQFVLDAQRHIEQQEAVLLPSLFDACPLEEINHVGRQMRHAMKAERAEIGD